MRSIQGQIGEKVVAKVKVKVKFKIEVMGIVKLKVGEKQTKIRGQSQGQGQIATEVICLTFVIPVLNDKIIRKLNSLMFDIQMLNVQMIKC